MEDSGDTPTQQPGTGQGASSSGSGRDIETHFTVIAVIELVLGIPFLLGGILVFVGGMVGAGFAEAFGDVPGIGGLIAGAGLVIGLLIIALAAPGIISAVGLLKREPWAKVWTLVVAVLNILNIPFGTAFGIYAIWVMTRPETDRALGRTTRPGPT